MSEIEAFIPKKRNRKNSKSAHRRTTDFNRKNLRKYKSQRSGYLKIDENILGNLSEILQSLTKAKKKRFVFNHFGGSTNTKSTAAESLNFLKMEFSMLRI